MPPSSSSSANDCGCQTCAEGTSLPQAFIFTPSSFWDFNCPSGTCGDNNGVPLTLSFDYCTSLGDYHYRYDFPAAGDCIIEYAALHIHCYTTQVSGYLVVKVKGDDSTYSSGAIVFASGTVVDCDNIPSRACTLGYDGDFYNAMCEDTIGGTLEPA